MKLSVCVLNIHIVESGTAKRHYFYSQFLQMIDHRGVDRIIDEGADRIISRCQLNRILVELGLKIFYIEPIL
jgi:hypothetical protein